MVKNQNLTQQRILRKKVRKLTLGITDAITNVALYLFYVIASSAGSGSGSRGVYRAFDQADELIEELNAKQIRKALYNLCQKGLILKLREARTLPKITKTGLKRLQAKFPFYDQQRIWDKQLYLVTYDIPIKYNWHRNILRNNLEKLKAKAIQKSVYLTPYNPRDLISNITKENKINGHILISTLNPKDAFGTVDIKEFLWDVYKLEDINQKYALFIGHNNHLKLKDILKKGLRMRIVFEYLSILKNDPQLPFELLPDKYLGDEAYLLFKRLTGIKTF